MTSRFECIITGCALQMGSSMAIGDLHEFGDVWVFNAVLQGGEARWFPMAGGAFPHRDKFVDITGVEFFERRGVFIFQRDTSLMNDTAKLYVGVAE